jgi:hypothetical protein
MDKDAMQFVCFDKSTDLENEHLEILLHLHENVEVHCIAKKMELLCGSSSLICRNRRYWSLFRYKIPVMVLSMKKGP